jgi:hypothetical protein
MVNRGVEGLSRDGAGGIATTPEDPTIRLSKLEGLYAQPERVSTTDSALPTVPQTLSSRHISFKPICGNERNAKSILTPIPGDSVLIYHCLTPDRVSDRISAISSISASVPHVTKPTRTP